MKAKGPTIRVTLSGPAGSGKTQIKYAICRYFMRARRAGKLPADRITFREVQTKDAAR
jgi:Ni2+-binding GTPase involved in maturation of urease and hydrogenase